MKKDQTNCMTFLAREEAWGRKNTSIEIDAPCTTDLCALNIFTFKYRASQY